MPPSAVARGICECSVPFRWVSGVQGGRGCVLQNSSLFQEGDLTAAILILGNGWDGEDSIWQVRRNCSPSKLRE